MLLKTSYKMKPPISVRLNLGHRLSKGLVGWWNFEGLVHSKIFDRSGNENHGTIVGNSYFVAGKFGQAMDFDGDDDYISVSSAKMSAGAGTLCVWCKYDAIVTGGVSGDYVMGRRTTAGDLLYLSGSKLSEHWIGIGDVWTSTSVALVKDVWMMLTLTWDGTNYRWYKNACMCKGDTYEDLDTVGSEIIIGGLSKDDAFLTGYCLDGQIDSVQIYNRALSAGEVTELYLRTFAPFAQRGILTRLPL